MTIVQIDNWRDYRRDGEQFLRTATAAHDRKKKSFSADTLYNLTCMAIEKLIMAFLMKHGDLAENHTMGDLLRALERHLGQGSEIADDLMYLDSFQEICDLDSYVVHIPTDDDVVRILGIGARVQGLLGPYLTSGMETDKHLSSTRSRQ